MSKFTRIRIFVIAISIFIIPVIAMLAYSQEATAQPKTWQRSFDSWSYAGYVDSDGYVNARVRLQDTTVGGLEKYATANRLLADQLWRSGQQTMQLEVILKHPLSIDALSQLRTRTGVTIQTVEGRFYSAGGERETISWVVDNTSDLNSPLLDRAQADISAKSGTAHFAGLYSFKGITSRKSYTQLINEPEVFVVDVTINQIQHDVGNNIPMEKVSMVTGPAIFWLMEDAGLNNFK